MPINVVAIAGSQCRMEVLGAICEESGGDLDIVQATEVLAKFSNLAEEQVIATNVDVKLLVHRQMSIVTDPPTNDILTVLKRDIGTVVSSTSASFEFRVRTDIPCKEEKLPFQVQTSYSRLDGFSAGAHSDARASRHEKQGGSRSCRQHQRRRDFFQRGAASIALRLAR